MHLSQGNRFSIGLTWPARVSALLGLFLLLIPAAWAQLPQASDTTSPPTPGVGHDYIHSPVETVNPANGSVSIRIPVRVSSGRELTIPLSIAYDSSGAFYYGQTGNTPPQYATILNVPFSLGGWSYTFPMMTSSTGSWTAQGPTGKNFTCLEGINYVFQDPTGNRHNMGLADIPTNEPGEQYCGGTGPGILQGGEGPIQASTSAYHQPVTVIDGNGTVYSFPSLTTSPTSITDRNGNTISISSTSSSSTVTDTAGRTAISVGTFGASPDSINVAGLSSPYQVSWTTASASFTISTFNLPGSTACPTSMSGSAKAASQIVLPNGQKYTFTYDPTYGMLTKITYPSGGYVRYAWGLNPQAELFSGATYDSNGVTVASYDCRYDFPAITDRYVSFDGTTEVLHQHFSYNTNWPSGSDHYTSKTTTVTTYDLVRATNFNTVYTYSAVGVPCVPDLNPNANDDGCVGNNDTEQMPVEQTIQYYSTSGALLKTVGKTWCNNNPRELCSETTTLNDTGQVSEATYTYNTSEQQTERDEYDYGPQLTRKTVTNYASFTGANIVDLPSSVITYNGSGTRVAETDSSYDQTGLQPTSVVQHGAAGSARGNLTTVTKQCFNGACAGGNPTTTYSYYDTGQIYQMTDPKGNVTTFSYTDSYSSCGGNAPPSGATNAYLTQVTYPPTNGVNHIESYCYDYTAGLLRGSTDENGQTSSFAYADSLDRLTQANYPDGGQTLVSYNDAPTTPSVTTEKKLDSTGRFVTSVSITDGIGLPIETELTSDPQGTDFAVTTYDGLGRAYTVTNPYRSTSDPTYGVTTYTYDALSRPTSVTKPDGSVVGTAYSGNCTTVTDEAGKNRESCTDGLGRMTSVIENPGGLNYTTSYTYDTLDDLLSVAQNGSRSRSFSYDSLKRITSSTNPEAGAVTYGYDANSNVATKTDGRGITTTNTFDALNRVTKTTYSDSTPAIYLNYDGTTQTGCTASISDSYPIGHETGMCDAAGSEAWSHDTMGRTLTDHRTTNGVTKSFAYTYAPNLEGSINSITYPSGLVITYAYDTAERPVSAADQHSVQYATGVTYAPQGAIQTATMDATSNFAGFSVSNSYTKRLQPNELKVTNGSTAIMDFSYCFYALSGGACPSTGTTDNGNVMGVTNNMDTTRSQTFTYDALNRLSTGASVNTSGTNCWGEQYGYDAWANLLTVTKPSGYSACSQPDNLSISVTVNNQISGYTYDGAGNLNVIPGTGGGTFTYNAESEMISTAGVNYTYDGDGKRVEKSNGTLYWYGAGSDALEETNLTGSWQRDYVFFGGQRIAARTPLSAVLAYFDNHLGSTSKFEDITSTGSVTQAFDADYYPFGRAHQFADSYDPGFKFEGKEHDFESGLDNFGARFYTSNLGRFMSADWSAVPAPVPYANLTNPQTLNLYAMVSDNPETFADLDGHDGGCNTASTGSVGSGDHNTCPGPAATQNAKQGEGQSTGDGTKKSDSQQAQAPQQQNQQPSQASAGVMALPLIARTLAGAADGAEAGSTAGTVEPGGGNVVGAVAGATLGAITAAVAPQVYAKAKDEARKAWAKFKTGYDHLTSPSKLGGPDKDPRRGWKVTARRVANEMEEHANNMKGNKTAANAIRFGADIIRSLIPDD